MFKLAVADILMSRDRSFTPMSRHRCRMAPASLHVEHEHQVPRHASGESITRLDDQRPALNHGTRSSSDRAAVRRSSAHRHHTWSGIVLPQLLTGMCAVDSYFAVARAGEHQVAGCRHGSRYPVRALRSAILAGIGIDRRAPEYAAVT